MMQSDTMLAAGSKLSNDKHPLQLFHHQWKRLVQTQCFIVTE